MKSSAEVAANSSPKDSTTARSSPSESNMSIFWRRSVRSRGAFSGRRVRAGWVSNVTTVLQRPSVRARSVTRRRIS